MLIAWFKGGRTKVLDLLKCPNTTAIITNKNGWEEEDIVSEARRRCICGFQKLFLTCFLLLAVPVCLNDNELH